MASRYSRVFTLPKNLYLPGSPVVIQAGALLKDEVKDAVIAQLKFKNITDKPIKAIRICIMPRDVVGNKNGEDIIFDYLDLNLRRDASYGDRIPVPLSDKFTREFDVSVKQVVFADKTKWESTSQKWESLKLVEDKKPFSSGNDSELVKQYQIKFGDRAVYYPQEEQDLWYCACGEINNQSEDTCHSCGCRKDGLFPLLIDALKADRDKRLLEIQLQKQLQEENELAEKKQIAEQKKVKKLKIIYYIEVAVVVALLIFILYLWLK